jgi:general secretion pathway protein M
MTIERARILRWAAILVFLAIPLVAAVVTAFNIALYSETNRLIEDQERMLADFTTRLDRLKRAGTAGVDAGAIYVAAASRPLAGAALQQRLRGAVEAAQGKLIETQQSEAGAEAPADEVSVRVTLDADNEGLLALLHSLESGLPLLTIDALAIRRLPDTDATDPGNPSLRVDLAVRAHFRAAL